MGGLGFLLAYATLVVVCDYYMLSLGEVATYDFDHFLNVAGVPGNERWLFVLFVITRGRSIAFSVVNNRRRSNVFAADRDWETLRKWSES